MQHRVNDKLFNASGNYFFHRINNNILSSERTDRQDWRTVVSWFCALLLRRIENLHKKFFAFECVLSRSSFRRSVHRIKMTYFSFTLRVRDELFPPKSRGRAMGANGFCPPSWIGRAESTNYLLREIKNESCVPPLCRARRLLNLCTNLILILGGWRWHEFSGLTSYLIQSRVQLSHHLHCATDCDERVVTKESDSGFTGKLPLDGLSNTGEYGVFSWKGILPS